MSKAKIIDKKSIESILGEKRILSELHHPFIVNMIYSFQDFDYLYLVMEILSGGNLRYHLSIKKHFNESQIKFLIGCIMIGLKYIHGKNILHRDIKPENLVFDQNGYLRITDFGIAKHYVINNKKDTSGTIGYLAPEVLCNVNHNFSIDYYAVGIITYELMYGHRPYIGKNKHEVKQLILTRQAKIEYDDLPYGFSNNIANYINGLIQRKPKNRLGKNDINEVLNHPWFNDFDWENCYNKKLKAPYVPKYGDNFDKNYCLQSNKIGTDTMERYGKIMSKENIHMVFKEFNCTKIPKELKGFSNKKSNDNVYMNNNISSNMSTTSISRNNKNENKNNNLRAYNNYKNMNNNRSTIKNKILSNDIENVLYRNNVNINKSLNILNKTIFEMNPKKYLNYIKHKVIEANNLNINNPNNSNKTYRNDNYLNKKNKNNYFMDLSNLNISGINNNNHQKYNNNIDENLIYSKVKQDHLNRNISAKYINRNKSKIIFNNSTIDSKNNINSGILKNMDKQEIKTYKNKKKLMNHSCKVTKKKNINNYYKYNNNNNNDNIRNNSGVYYNKVKNKNNINMIKENTSIYIPKTKRDYIGKDLLRNNQSLYYQSINESKPMSNLISSTIYSKNNSNTKRMVSSNSMKHFSGNNYFNDQINNNGSLAKSKSNLFDSINSSRSSKNILSYDKKYPLYGLSVSNKKEIENNDEYYEYNRYKNNIKYENVNNRQKNGLNYDYLNEKIRNKRIKN